MISHSAVDSACQYNGSRNGQNGSKYGRKLRYIIPEILTVDYSSFDFQLSRYNFTKLYRSSKALPKRMALVKSAFISQKCTFNFIIRSFNDDLSRTNTSGGPRVRDPWLKGMY